MRWAQLGNFERVPFSCIAGRAIRTTTTFAVPFLQIKMAGDKGVVASGADVDNQAARRRNIADNPGPIKLNVPEVDNKKSQAKKVSRSANAQIWHSWVF